MSTNENYDIIVVGGGLGGSALAYGMAGSGAKVLVLESETQFRDRIRGEFLSPWGVAESRNLGIYQSLINGGAHPLAYFNVYRGPELVAARPLAETTHSGEQGLAYYHPQIQEALLEAAISNGAVVRRGARVTQVVGGPSPTVVADISGLEAKYFARLVVGADGRNSNLREWGGFTLRSEPNHNIVGGVLLDNCPAPEDHGHIWPNPFAGTVALIFPQGQGRVRAYVGYDQTVERRLSGDSDFAQFVDMAQKCGAPPEYYDGVKISGPLSTFHGAARWVEHPYRNGIALIGDAAYASDPSFGQGMSLTLRDARVLRDQLLNNSDWEQAANRYATEHDRYQAVAHTFELWETQISLTVGPEADAIRGPALAGWDQDPSRRPDVLFSGPDLVLDESIRKRYFGEE